MTITQEIFEHFCPVAINPGNGIFTAVTNALSLRMEFVRTVLGPELIDRVNESGFSPLHTPLDDFEELCRAVARYVCVSAFNDSVPQLDLVLTDTGFGIVSNGNVAPASSDRVQRLLSSFKREMDDAFDDILSSARTAGGWSDSEYARPWFKSIFWRGRDARLFGDPMATRSALDSLTPVISSAEVRLKELVSPEFFQELCAYCRNGVFSPVMQQVLSFARNYVVSLVKDDGSVSVHKRMLLGFLEKYPEEFNTYISSSAFRANHFKPYENRKEDPCFFFG